MTQGREHYVSPESSFRKLRITGIACIVLAALGILYNAASIWGYLGAGLDKRDPDFRLAYWAMSSFCMACYVTLICIGIQLYRLRTRWCYGLTALMAAEFAYNIFIHALWQSPLGPSVAAATGIANGGMSIQLFAFLFPIWGPVVSIRAHRTIISVNGSRASQTGPTRRGLTMR